MFPPLSYAYLHTCTCIMTYLATESCIHKSNTSVCKTRNYESTLNLVHFPYWGAVSLIRPSSASSSGSKLYKASGSINTTKTLDNMSSKFQGTYMYIITGMPSKRQGCLLLRFQAVHATFSTRDNQTRKQRGEDVGAM